MQKRCGGRGAPGRQEQLTGYRCEDRPALPTHTWETPDLQKAVMILLVNTSPLITVMRSEANSTACEHEDTEAQETSREVLKWKYEKWQCPESNSRWKQIGGQGTVEGHGGGPS